jgi:Peptidase A4 family
MNMTILGGRLSGLPGAVLLGMIVPWMACASGSEDEILHRAPTVAPRQHAPAIIREKHGRNATSSNWSGYAVTGADGSVSDVKGSWIVPASTCSSTNQYASFWVGIDGYDSNTVEQIGTDSDCQNGSPVYYAWYEFYPHFSYGVPITVQPGDVISAEVKYSGGKFTVTITDGRTMQSWSTSQKMPNAKRSSAEWIVEAPSSGGILPLADFGIIDFGAYYTKVSGTCYATVGGGAAELSALSQALSKSPWSLATEPSCPNRYPYRIRRASQNTWGNSGP